MPAAATRRPCSLTGDHDDRVVPGHSFKFAAALQAAADTNDASCGLPAPVLVRTETSAGHGHGLPTTKAIAKATDVLAFIEGTVGDAAAPSPEPRRSFPS